MQPDLKKHERLADRLVKILSKLNSGDSVCVKDLAQELKCSERTISRDLVRFDSALILDKNGAYYSLQPQFVGKLNFKDIENFAQISGIQNLYPRLDNGFIRELLDARAGDVFAAKGYHHEDAEAFLPLFECFKPAIEQSYAVSFLYKGTPRTVEPYKIVHHHGSWYLAAVREHALRAYRLSRIELQSSLQNNELAMVYFKPDPEITKQLVNEENIWFGHDKMEVILSVDAEVAMYFKQRQLLPEQEIVRDLEDGGVLVSSTVTHKTQILPLVRYWIPHIKIVSPESLKNQLKQSLHGYLEVV